MIKYDVLWKTMKKKGISQYKLIVDYNVSRGLLDRLKKNASITTHTINTLCDILDCDINDIVEYVKDEKETKEE